MSPDKWSPAPNDVDEILSATWLNRALEGTYPGAITAVREVERIDSSANKVRFVLEWADDSGTHHVPLCVKGYFTAANAHYMATGSREANFYLELAQHAPIQMPAVVYAGVDTDTKHGIVIMADLIADGAEFLSALRPYSVNDVAESLTELAAFHAAFWDDSRFKNRPWLQARYAMYPDLLTDVELDELLAGPRGDGIPPDIRVAKRLKNAVNTIAVQDENAVRTLLHADAHAGNLYRARDGRIGFVDWQNCWYGSWSIDAAYHIASALETDDRVRSERDLLRHYLDALGLGERTPTWEAAWHDYRTALAWGYYLWAITRRVDPTIVTTFNHRLGAAVAMHDSLGLLGV